MAIDTANGTERRSDGLWVHHGKLSVGPAGIDTGGTPVPYLSGDLNINRGNNAGAIYFGARGNQYLFCSGTGFSLVGGPLSITGGLAPGSANTYLASYFATSGLKVPQANTWWEHTEVRCNFTGSANATHVIIDWGAQINLPVGHTLYIGVGYDGTLQWPSQGLWTNQGNQPCDNHLSGRVINAGPLAGARRMSLWFYGTATACGSSVGAYSQLWVTEFKA